MKAEVDVDFEVRCDECGNGLCGITNVDGNSIHVGPCEKCLEEAKQEGHDEGYNEGYDEAKEES